MPGLRLPSFVDESVQVVTNDDNTVPSCYATQAWNQAVRTQKMVINAEHKSAHTHSAARCDRSALSSVPLMR